MYRIITTVGASLFRNTKLQDYNKIAFRDADKRGEWESECTRVKDWVMGNYWGRANTSAEIASILAIKEEIEKNEERDIEVQVHLICAHTLASVLAADCIIDLLKFYKIDNAQSYSIEGLQVKDRRKFENIGLPKLLNKLEELIFYNEENKKNKNDVKPKRKLHEDVIFNITGGYKAVAPHLSVLGQMYRIPLYYGFEESEQDTFELLQMPQLPVQFDWLAIERFSHYLSSDNTLNQYLNHPENHESEDDVEELIKLGLIRKNNLIYEINVVGQMMWRHINSKRPESPSIMGLFAEYKVYEFFNENHKQFGRPKRSEKCYDETKKIVKAEIDILLTTPSGYSFSEVKSIGQVKDFAKKEKDQLTRKIEALTADGKKPEHFYLVMHKIATIRLNLDEGLQESLNILKNICEKHSIGFSIHCINLVLNKNKDGFEYTNFLNDPIDSTEFNKTIDF